MMPLSLRARLLLAASGLFLVGLLLGWQTAVDGPDATGLKVMHDDWSEPANHSEDSAKLVAALNQHSLWGETGPATAAPSAEDLEKAAKAAADGDGLLLGTAVHDPLTVQRPLAEAHKYVWDNANWKGTHNPANSADGRPPVAVATPIVCAGARRRSVGLPGLKI